TDPADAAFGPLSPVRAPAARELSPLSLHDALPIWRTTSSSTRSPRRTRRWTSPRASSRSSSWPVRRADPVRQSCTRIRPSDGPRSEEHTSELQSRFDLVCRLLLEKKKNSKERQQRR